MDTGTRASFHIMVLSGFYARVGSKGSAVAVGFLGGSDGKDFVCSAGDLGSIPGLESSPGGGHGNPF